MSITYEIYLICLYLSFINTFIFRIQANTPIAKINDLSRTNKKLGSKLFKKKYILERILELPAIPNTSIKITRPKNLNVRFILDEYLYFNI